MRGHRGLGDLERLAERRHLEHVQSGTQQQVGELDGLLLQLLGLGGGPGGGDCGDHGSLTVLFRWGPDQGSNVLLRGEEGGGNGNRLELKLGGSRLREANGAGLLENGTIRLHRIEGLPRDKQLIGLPSRISGAK